MVGRPIPANTIHMFERIAKPDSRSENERAVSPVIGVILMVAITVILAAVIGVMVFGLADDLGDSPTQATLSFENQSGNLVISHDGGDTLDFEEGDYSLIVDGDTVFDDLGVDEDNHVSDANISSGESITVDAEGDYWDEAPDVEVAIRDNNADSVVDDGTVDFSD